MIHLIAYEQDSLYIRPDAIRYDVNAYNNQVAKPKSKRKVSISIHNVASVFYVIVL